MSKIQDAIRRLRSDNDPAESIPTGEHPILDIAPAAEPGISDTPASVWEYGGREIQIDRARLIAAGLLEPADSQKSVIGEYRPIRQAVVQGLTTNGDTPPLGNLTAVSSALAKEGRTFLSLNLAMNLAKDPKHSVVLVDGDSSNQHLSEVLGVKSEQGLTDWIAEPSMELDNVIMPTDIADLAILPIGQRGAQTVSLLSDGEVSDRLATVSALDKRRIFLFDSPAVLGGESARALAKHVGQVIFVVCAGKTPRSAVRDALIRLGRDRPVKIVLNQVLARSEPIAF